jgi:hypothetical protein
MWPYTYDPNPVHKEAPAIKIDFDRVQILTKERAAKEKAAMLKKQKDRMFNPEEKLLPNVSSSESFKHV